jgi:alpha-1,2-mannosyltransferase
MGRMQMSSIPGVRAFGDRRFRRTAAMVVCAGATAHFLLVLLASFGNMPDLREVFIPSARAAYGGLLLYHPLPIGAPGHFTVGTSGAVDTPPFLLMMWPWTVVGDNPGQLAWEALQVLAVVVAVGLTYAGIGRPTSTELLVAFSLLMFLGPVRDSFQDGQVSTILGALMAGALLAHQKGKHLAGGVLLGIAGALKLTPLLTLPYFIWKRDIRLCAWATGTSVALFVVSIGSGRANGFAAFPGVISQLSAGTAAAQNQSLSGLILRFVLPGRTSFPIVPPPLDLRLLIVTGQVVMVGLLVWLVGRVVVADPLRSWLQFSLVLLLVPTLQPFAWPHHWAWAVLVVPVCVHLASRRLLHPAAAYGLLAAYLALTIFEFPLYTAATAGATHPQLDPLLALGASLPLFTAVAVALLLALGTRPLAGGTPGTADVAPRAA